MKSPQRMTATFVTGVALTGSEKSPGAAVVTLPLVSAVELSGPWQECVDFVVRPEFKCWLSRKKKGKIAQDLLSTLGGFHSCPLFGILGVVI